MINLKVISGVIIADNGDYFRNLYTRPEMISS